MRRIFYIHQPLLPRLWDRQIFLQAKDNYQCGGNEEQQMQPPKSPEMPLDFCAEAWGPGGVHFFHILCLFRFSLPQHFCFAFLLQVLGEVLGVHNILESNQVVTVKSTYC